MFPGLGCHLGTVADGHSVSHDLVSSVEAPPHTRRFPGFGVPEAWPVSPGRGGHPRAWPGRGRCPAAPQPCPGSGAGAGAAVGAAAARDVRRQEEEEAGAQEVGAARGLPPVTPGRASESRATGAQLVLGKRLQSL